MADPQRCRQCGATLAPGAQWCSLCLTAVTTADATAAPPDPTPPTSVPPPTTPPVVDVPPPPGMSAPPPTTPPVAPGPDPVDPDAWLALLAAEERKSTPTLLSAGSGDRGRRGAIMIGGAVAIIAVLTIIMVLLSWLVDRPS